MKTYKTLKVLSCIVSSIAMFALETWAIITIYNFFAYEVFNFPLIGWVEGLAFRLFLSIFVDGKSKK